MAKDYASSTVNKRRSTHSKSSKKQSYSVFFKGFVSGAALMLIVIIFRIPIMHFTTHLLNKNNPEKTLPSSKQKNEPSTPHFDFYTLLPKLNVPVNKSLTQTAKTPLVKTPTANTQASNDTPTAIKKAQTPKTFTYMIQVASFKNYQDADTLKAKLALLGFNATIKVANSNNQQYNRVFIGPFQTAALAQNTKQQLASNHYSSIVLRYRQ